MAQRLPRPREGDESNEACELRGNDKHESQPERHSQPSELQKYQQIRVCQPRGSGIVQKEAEKFELVNC